MVSMTKSPRSSAASSFTGIDALVLRMASLTLLVVVTADPHFNAVMTVDAFQCNRNHRGNQIRIDRRFALDDFPGDLQ